MNTTVNETQPPLPEPQTPRTDALWIQLMDACKKSGIAPANANTVFKLIDSFRTLEREAADLRAEVERLNSIVNERK